MRILDWFWTYWIGAASVAGMGLLIATVLLIVLGIGEGNDVRVDTSGLEAQVASNSEAVEGLGERVGELSTKVEQLPRQFAEELSKGSVVETQTTGTDSSPEGFMKIPSKKVLWCPDKGEVSSRQEKGGGIEIDPLQFRWTEVSTSVNACPGS